MYYKVVDLNSGDGEGFPLARTVREAIKKASKKGWTLHSMQAISWPKSTPQLVIVFAKKGKK